MPVYLDMILLLVSGCKSGPEISHETRILPVGSTMVMDGMGDLSIEGKAEGITLYYLSKTVLPGRNTCVYIGFSH